MKPPEPGNERERLAALREYRILDTPPEAAYDDITLLAARLCAAPIALITLVDRERLWFKSRLGLEAEATPRDAAFCAQAILTPDDVFVVPDVRADPRFADNPLVTGAPGLRFYAGAPLVTRDGHALGTLCVLDRVPRTLEPEQAAALRALRRQVVNELELRRYAAEQAESRAGMEAQQLRHTSAELDKTRQHLEQAQATARLGSWELDPATGRGFWSAENYRLFGRDPAAGPPTFDEFLELVHPEDRAAIQVFHARAKAEGSARIESRTNPARGPLRWIEGNVSAVSRHGRIVLEGTAQDVSERVRLIERERRARELAETLGQANLALAQKGDLETVLEIILDYLARLVPYDSASVVLLEEGGRGLAVRAARGYERWTDADMTDRIVLDPATNPILDGVLSSGEPSLVPDSLEEPRWQRVAGAEHVRSWLGVPIVQQGRTIALFSVDKTEPGFFTVEHVRLAQALAPAAAAAIANARLVADLREQEARLQLAIEASNLGPRDWDLRTNTVHFSAEWKRQIGHEEHEIQDRYEEWESRLHPEDRESTLAALRAYLDGRRPEYEVEFRESLFDKGRDTS